MKKNLLPMILSAVMVFGAGTIAISQPDIATLTASAADTTISGDVELKANAVCNGDLYITGGTLKLNGYSLIVNGTVYQSGGTLVIGSGKMKVTGNYELQNKDGTYGNGELNMYVGSGVLDVDGNVIINTTAEANHQALGTLQIGGDLKVYSPYGGKGLQCYNGHTTIFKGDNTHEIYFDSTDYNYLNYVGMEGNGQMFLTGETTGFTLSSDVTFANESTISGSRTLSLNSHTLTVDGSFTQNGALTVDVSGSNLEMSGTYYQPKGTLVIGAGSAHIAGNYEEQYQDETYGSGELNMYSAGGILDVDGNVIINTTAEANHQALGTLSIGGDLRVYNPYGGKGLQCYNGHVTEFKGDAVHEVYFDSADYNYLNRVQMTGNGEILLTGATTGFTLASNATFANNSTISGSRELNFNGNTVTINGDFIQNGTTVNVSSSTMNVSGTYYQPKGTLVIGTGSAHIAGNYELQNKGDSYGGGDLSMYSGGGLLDVNGDVIINTTVEADYQANGTLVIGGNLTVYAPYGGKGYRSYNGHATEFKGGKAHTVYFANTESYFNRIRLGVGDSLEFTGALSGVAKADNSLMSVSPADIASVSDLTVTGIAKGEGTITFSTGNDKVSKTLIIGDTVDGDEPVVTPPVEPPVATSNGDVSEDGNFNLLDLVLMKKWLANVPDVHLTNWKNGDFNEDGKLNVIDFALMKKALLSSDKKTSEMIATNFNIATVYNKPTAESTFTVDKDCTVYSLMTYHWNNQKGTAQTGTIGLLEDGVSLGTWSTVGTDGMYHTPNAVWWAYPTNLTLKAGHTYTIIDSDPDTWSQNGGSGGQGFFEVKGFFN